jgi:hypothetical protein
VLAAHASSPVVALPVQLLFSLPAAACVPVALAAAADDHAAALLAELAAAGQLPPAPLALVSSLQRSKTSSACRALFAAGEAAVR